MSASLAAAPAGDCAHGAEALARNARDGSARNAQPRKRRRKCADTAAGANQHMDRAQVMERSTQCPKRQNAKPRVLRKHKLSGDCTRGAAGHGRGFSGACCTGDCTHRAAGHEREFGGSAYWRLRARGGGAWVRAWRRVLYWRLRGVGRPGMNAGLAARAVLARGAAGHERGFGGACCTGDCARGAPCMCAGLAAVPTDDCTGGAEARAHDAGNGSTANALPRKRRRKCADTAAGANPRMDRAHGMASTAARAIARVGRWGHERGFGGACCAGDCASGALGHERGLGGSTYWRLRARGGKIWRAMLGTEAHGTHCPGNDGANVRALQQVQTCAWIERK